MRIHFLVWLILQFFNFLNVFTGRCFISLSGLVLGTYFSSCIEEEKLLVFKCQFVYGNSTVTAYHISDVSGEFIGYFKYKIMLSSDRDHLISYFPNCIPLLSFFFLFLRLRFWALSWTKLGTFVLFQILEKINALSFPRVG